MGPTEGRWAMLPLTAVIHLYNRCARLRGGVAWSAATMSPAGGTGVGGTATPVLVSMSRLSTPCAPATSQLMRTTDPRRCTTTCEAWRGKGCWLATPSRTAASRGRRDSTSASGAWDTNHCEAAAEFDNTRCRCARLMLLAMTVARSRALRGGAGAWAVVLAERFPHATPLRTARHARAACGAAACKACL